MRHAILLRLGFRVFDGPTRVAVLLSELRRLVLPVLGNATVTERLLLLLCVALLRRRDESWHRQSGRSSPGNQKPAKPRRSAGTRRRQHRLASVPHGMSRSYWHREPHPPC